jgi:hypothetical protein
MEDSEVVLEVYTHGELIRTGAGNCDAFINYKLVARQRNGSGHREGNRVTVIRIDERLT